MAEVVSRINLGAKWFPFLAQQSGRTIIVPQYDQNFNRQTYSPEDQDKDIGIPQVYYMHNVMPTANGMQSVAWETVVFAQGTDVTFDDVFNLIDDLGNSALLGICTDGKWYIRQAGYETTWRLIYTSSNPGIPVYAAYCSGTTYIWQKHTGCQIYSFTTHLLTTQILTGLDLNNTTGLCSSYGYLIGWTTAGGGGNLVVDITSGSNYILYDSGYFPNIGDIIVGTGIPAGSSVGGYHTGGGGSGTRFVMSLACTATTTGLAATVASQFPGGIFWSSTIDPTDFTPSLITGAGGGQIQGARGPINLVFPHTKGLLVYCGDNIVAGPYTGNPRYPFDFQAIVGSGGVSDKQLVTQEEEADQHYAFTEVGLQIVTMLGSTIIFPEVTDFLGGAIYEDYDDPTNVFTRTEIDLTGMAKRFKSVLNRYLCISYGPTKPFTYILVYDQITKRWGKLKTPAPHVQVIELSQPDFPTYDISRNGLGIVGIDGRIFRLDFDPLNTDSDGTLILGKYQFVRSRLLILEEIELETVYHHNNLDLTVLTSYSGKDTDVSTVPYFNNGTADGAVDYLCRVEGVNHSLLLQGQFNLNSGVIHYSIGGKR